MYTTKFINSINKLNPDEWDELTGDNIFASHGWLKTVEETFIGPMELEYILLVRSKKISAAAVCCIFNRSDKVETLDDMIFGRLRKYFSKLGISFLPAYICGPFFSFGKHLMVERKADPGERKLIINKIFNVIKDRAAEKNLGLSFINVMEEEHELINLLNRNGYNKALHIPLNYLGIEWSSFKAYKKHLSEKVSRNISKTIGNEINKNMKGGSVIQQLENPEECPDRLYELVSENYHKHNQKPFLFEKGFFYKVKQNLGKSVVLYTSVKSGVITGVCLLFKKNGIGYLPIVGVDHERTGNDYTYFNLLYYKPTKDAIMNKMTKLYYGRGMYELKARRGCKTKNLYIYYKSSRGINNIAIRPWFRILSWWVKNKLPNRINT